MAATSVSLTTIGIVVILAYQTFQFFQLVTPIDFLTGTVWSASIQPYQFGVLPAGERERCSSRPSR